MAKREAKVKHRRQVVIVIVEGQSDENALAVPLTEAFEKKYGPDVIVLFAKIKNANDRDGGDITSRLGVVPDKLQMLMNKLIIMPCLDDYSLMPKYITEIVHIIDTDGVYIPDDRVFYDLNAIEQSKPVYLDDSISASDPQKIIDRNARKRSNIEKLLGYQKTGFDIQNFHETGRGNKPTTKACNVPYSLYYFSCNLDHFTSNERNLKPFQKVTCADDFARRHANDVYSFVAYIDDDVDALKNMTYAESWERLKIGTNSLKRSTNIGLLLHELIKNNFEIAG